MKNFALPLVFSLILFGLTTTLRSQSVVGDFECQAAGASVGIPAPDCEGWSEVTSLAIGGGTGTGAAITGTSAAGCPGMPTNGSQFLSLAAIPDITGGIGLPPAFLSPMPMFPSGNTTGVWPFFGGAVAALEIEFMATDSSISVDWMLTNVTGNPNHFFEILLVDGATTQIIAPIVVTETANETFLPMVCSPPTSQPSGNLNDATVVQTSTAVIPSAFIGQMIRVVIALGPTDSGSGALTDTDVVALVDNIRLGTPPPSAISSDELVVSAGPLVAGATPGFVTTSGTVDGVIDAQGNLITDPTLDSVIGATFTLTGNLAAGDANLDGGFLTVTTLDIVASPGADELKLTGTYAQDLSRERSRLGGTLDVLPSADRPLVSAIFASPNRTGTGSNVLDQLASSIGTQGRDLTLLFEIVPGQVPQLTRLIVDYAPGPQAPEFNFDTNGSGNLVLGVAGANPADELFNVFVVNPTVAQGQGSFFGLEYTPFVDTALTSPLGTVPFHVSPNPNGSFFWGIPGGAVPIGTVLDGAAGTVDPTTGNATWVSPVVRRTF